MSALPDGVAIRPVERRDLDAVAARLLRLDAHGAARDGRHPVAADARAWRDTVAQLLALDASPRASLVATADDALVAALVGGRLSGLPALGHPPRGVVHALWVDEPFRRRGLGQALVARFLAGCPDGRCDVTTLVADEAAAAFWRATGFRDLYVQLRR